MVTEQVSGRKQIRIGVCPPNLTEALGWLLGAPEGRGQKAQKGH
jgi:hypothetical protein